MRWQFHDGADPAEAARRADVTARIDAWWRAFDQHAADLEAACRGKASFDIPAFMAQHLHAVDDSLCWEYGPALRGDGFRLVITPEGRHELRPMVATLLQRAPTRPGWEFYAYRLPESVDIAQRMVQARFNVAAPDAQVRLSRGRDNRVDAVFRAESFRDNERAKHVAFVLAENLFGEESLDHWVGAVEAEAPPRQGLFSKVLGRKDGDGGRFLPLDRAKPTLDALVAAIRDQLPDRPLHQLNLTGPEHQWTSYSLQPPEQPSDAGRDDLVFGSTAFMDLTRAAANPGFHSGRFSRHGETFCYLKLDHRDVPREQWVEFRGRFEDAIEPELRRTATGALFSAATGTMFSYIDLALTNVEQAMQTIRQALRPLDAPRNTWLLFFDPEYAAEWLGLWDDTPPPPGAQPG
jgi:hypothetical protein